MILVLAGTGEGRRVALALAGAGERVLVSTATVYGAELLGEGFRGEVSSGPLDLEAMLRLIRRRGVQKVVDATHPFAVEVSVTAREASRLAAIPYERLERERWAAETGETEGGVISAAGIGPALQLAAEIEGTIFLATGSNTLERYTATLGPDRLVVRILPLLPSLEKCLRLGLSPGRIIAMQGPFDEELNRLLFRRYGASLVISKDSGPAGGTPEKVRAARSLGIPIILIAPPGA